MAFQPEKGSAAGRAGLQRGAGLSRRNPHDMRHTYATILLMDHWRSASKGLHETLNENCIYLHMKKTIPVRYRDRTSKDICGAEGLIIEIYNKNNILLIW